MLLGAKFRQSSQLLNHLAKTFDSVSTSQCTFFQWPQMDIFLYFPRVSSQDNPPIAGLHKTWLQKCFMDFWYDRACAATFLGRPLARLVRALNMTCCFLFSSKTKLPFVPALNYQA
eukprot:6994-Pelagomonas_calceolata.AAC.2